MKRSLLALLSAASLAAASPAFGQSDPSICTFAPYRGATSAQGALARVTMTNRGLACVLTVYGKPDQKGEPADSGKITRAPRHGHASFDAPSASYTPAAGFAGEDGFEFVAWSLGRRMLVNVKVTVTPAAGG